MGGTRHSTPRDTLTARRSHVDCLVPQHEVVHSFCSDSWDVLERLLHSRLHTDKLGSPRRRSMPDSGSCIHAVADAALAGVRDVQTPGGAGPEACSGNVNTERNVHREWTCAEARSCLKQYETWYPVKCGSRSPA